jgi:DNA-binding transcriptional LysR family regulator
MAGDNSSPRALDHVQLDLSDRPAGEGQDHGVVSPATWRVGDLTLKHKLLLSGLGWGGMPEPMVRADIESGRLMQLDLPDWRGGVYPMQVAHKIETPPGPAGPKAAALSLTYGGRAALISRSDAFSRGD